MIEINKIDKHYKNEQSYKVINFCKIQENDIWIKAVLYKPLESNKLFVRSLNEFKEKFK